jgi:altronate dehydratase
MSVRSQIRRCVGTIACVSIPFLCGCAHQYEDAASPQWYLSGTQSAPNAAGDLLLGNAAPSSGDVSHKNDTEDIGRENTLTSIVAANQMLE